MKGLPDTGQFNRVAMMKSDFFIQEMREKPQKRTGSALDRILKDFDTHSVPDAGGETPETEFFPPPDKEEMTFPEEKPDKTAAAPDIEAIRQEAFAQGEEKQRIEMQAEFSARMQQAEQAHAAAINALQEGTFSMLAAGMAEGLEKGLEEIHTTLSRQVADILATLVGRHFTDEAIRIFSGRVAAESLNAVRPITIEGNKQLLASFQARPDFDLSQYRLRPTDDCELRFVNGETVVSTRLAPLLKELRELI